MANRWRMNGRGIQKYTGTFFYVEQMFQTSLVLCFLLLYLVFFPLFLHMCILSTVCLDVLCWTSRLSEEGARSRASPVNRALWLGMADSCWPRPWTAAGSEFAALPWHVWNDPAVVYCAAFVWFMLIYEGPPCNAHANSRACVWIKERYFLHALSCAFPPLLCGRESGVLVGHRNEAFEIQKLAHYETESLFSLFFTTAPSECMNYWKHHITFPHFPLMFSTLVFLALLLLKQRLILCEHMINSWERLTPSLQFFLTVVSFGGKLMTQLNFPLWVFLWGFCCYGAVRHVYEHAELFGQISIP